MAHVLAEFPEMKTTKTQHICVGTQVSVLTPTIAIFLTAHDTYIAPETNKFGDLGFGEDR